jgi:thiamine biosynthesis lipoprotein
MAARFELVIADAGDASFLQAAGEEALNEISDCERLLSVHRPDGELFRINAHAAKGPMRADPRVLQFIIQAQSLAELTHGTCDIAIGPLLETWRIQRTDTDLLSAPTEDDIVSALRLVNVRQQVVVDLHAETVVFTQPGVRLDPGALGKGWAIKRAITLLREHGITRALLHGGTSSVAAIGAPLEQSAWHIGIANPQNGSVIATALLSHNSLSVSALHGRQLISGGQSHGHIIDPRTGHPVNHTALSAIVHSDSVIAEAWSTALLIDHDVAQQCSTSAWLPTSTALVISDENNKLRCDISGSDFIPHHTKFVISNK